MPSTLMAQTVTAEAFADNLQVKYQILTNRNDENCDQKQTDGLCFQAQLSLTSGVDFSQSGWKIYFSNMAPIQMDESELFDITHINGDLHQITPSQNFTGFSENKTYDIKFRAGFWHLSHTDMMPNYYFVAEGKSPLVINSTVPSIDPDTGLEQLNHIVDLTLQDHHFKRTPNDSTSPATAEWLYQENADSFVNHDVSASILPTPKSIKQLKMAGSLDLSNGIKLSLEGISRSGIHAALVRLSSFGVVESEQGIVVNIKQDKSLTTEGYQFAVQRDSIEVSAATEIGAFYALQSIASLMMPNSLTLPFVVVDDEPRFEFRDYQKTFHHKIF